MWVGHSNLKNVHTYTARHHMTIFTPQKTNKIVATYNMLH